MPANDIEVFEYLTTSLDNTDEIDYLTYAIFAFTKREWIEYFESRNNRRPTQREIDSWIGEIMPHQFDQMRSQAAEFFQSAATEYLKDYIEEQKREAVRRSILSEVQNFTSPARHILIACIMAVIAPLILGGIIFLFSIFDKNFHPVIQLSPPSQSTSDK
jgi:hypothetical protein